MGDRLERTGSRLIERLRARGVWVDLLQEFDSRLNGFSADVLVSIHNNALPDGINPFAHNGSSVYYNHPRSIPLAHDVQQALLGRLGLRDLGIGRGDFALVRGTWMPSVLTEPSPWR